MGVLPKKGNTNMNKGYELRPISTTSADIEVLDYGQVESQRDSHGVLRLPDGQAGNLLLHQVEASNEGFVVDFTQYGRIRPPQDFVGNKLVMVVPRMGFDREKGLMVPMPWIVTSDRELFPLSPKELTARGIYSRVPLDDVMIQPRYSGDVVKGFCEEGWKGDLLGTFHLVRETLESHIDLRDPHQYVFLSLWIIGTYMFEGFESYPYVHVNGPKGVGKSTALDFLSRVCFNGELTPNISASAHFRLMHGSSSTLSIDELEKLYRKSLSDERMILLAGYKKGGTVLRSVNRGGRWHPKRFEVYGPRAFASQAGFEDVMASRTVKILMSRTTRNLGRLTRSAAEAVRDSCFLSAMTHAPMIRDVYTQMDDPSGIVPFAGREYELFQPIFAVAVATEDPSVVAAATEFALESHRGQLADFSESSTEHAYLSFLSEAIGKDGEYRGDVLLKAFNEYISDHDIELSKPLTAKSQGELLAHLGLADRAKKKRTADRKTRLYAFTREKVLSVARVYHVGVSS
jgi:hypothetical protein